jgi:WD40 repeat protein
VASLDGTLSVHDADGGSVAWSAQTSVPALDVAVAPDGREVALLSLADDAKRGPDDAKRSEVRFFDADTGGVRATFEGGPLEPLHETSRKMSYSPDGRHLIVPTGHMPPPLLLRTADGRRTELPAGAAVRAFTPDGRAALCLLTDGAAALVDPATGAITLRLPLRQPAEAGPGSWELNRNGVPVAFAPGSRRVAVGLDDGRVSVLSLETGREVIRLTGNGKPNGLAFSPDGSKLALTAINRGLTVWDLAAASEARVLAPGGEGQAVSRLAVRPGGGAVAALLAASGKHDLAVWDPATGQELLRTPTAVVGQGWASPRAKGSLVFSDDGRLAAGGTVIQVQPGGLIYARVAIVWAADGTILQVQSDQLSDAEAEAVAANRGDAGVVRFDAAGRLTALNAPRAAANGVDAVRLCCVDPFSLAAVWERAVPPVKGLVATPDGGRVALTFAAPAAALQVWDVAASQVLWELPAGLANLRLEAILCADGRRILTRPMAGTAPPTAPEWARRAVVWDALNGVKICALDPPSVPGAWNGRVVSAFAFSPDGRRLASFGGVPGVKVWDAASGRELLTLGDDGPAVTEVAFSEDGFLITADETGAVRAWDGRPGGK